MERRRCPWRSSRTFLVTVAVVSLFSEKVLYAFIVPILKHMVEHRLRLVPSKTQNISTAVLGLHGLCSLVSAPIVAHFADKTQNRKYILLASLLGVAVGSLIVAFTPSCMIAFSLYHVLLVCETSFMAKSNIVIDTAVVWALLLGRVIQGIAGSATWISSFAMLLDNIAPESKGTILALAMSFATSGLIAGPVISGTLFQVAGYWAAWSVPFALLGLDFVARISMVDRVHETTEATASPQTPDESTGGEEEGLLSSERNAYDTMERDECDRLRANTDESSKRAAQSSEPTNNEPGAKGFYRILLSDPRIWGGILITLGQSVIVATLENTLPLHVLNQFNWGTLPVGLMFLAIQGPAIILGPLVGALRDRLGLRNLTVLGWVIEVPFLWLLAVTGRPTFPWAATKSRAEAILISSVVGIGLGMLLIRGAGIFQHVAVTKEMEARDPAVFGPNGAASKISAIVDVSFNAGMLLGPIISGGLSVSVSYYYVNCVMALLAFLIAIYSWLYLVR